jgi:uncharacterized membrane protein YfcA
VYVPAAVALSAGALVSVQWGTKWNRRLPANVLGRVFALTLAVMAIFIGVRSAGMLGR